VIDRSAAGKDRWVNGVLSSEAVRLSAPPWDVDSAPRGRAKANPLKEDSVKQVSRSTISSRWPDVFLRRGVVLALCASAGVLASAAPALASSYAVTGLGSLGFGGTVATAINSSGQVTGESFLATEVQVRCPTPRHKGPCFTHPGHAFLWSSGTMTDLGTLGGLGSGGNAINDLGEVVGTSNTANGGVSAFADQNGVMTAIDPGSAAGVNRSGEITGSGGLPVAGTPGDIFTQAFTYQNGTTTVLGLLPGEGGVFSHATGINNSGEVVGFGDNSASLERAFKFQNGTMTDIGTLGGAQATATAINSSGQIVGSAGTSTGGWDGFLYSGGKMTDLGPNIHPTAINDSGVIVGQGPGGAEIDSGGTIQSLDNLLPAGSGVTLNTAVGINDNGQIVANGAESTGPDHAFLLTPN
jgi:probable HAF family extracellular repeat protein